RVPDLVQTGRVLQQLTVPWLERVLLGDAVEHLDREAPDETDVAPVLPPLPYEAVDRGTPKLEWRRGGFVRQAERVQDDALAEAPLRVDELADAERRRRLGQDPSAGGKELGAALVDARHPEPFGERPPREPLGDVAEVVDGDREPVQRRGRRRPAARGDQPGERARGPAARDRHLDRTARELLDHADHAGDRLRD